MLTILITGSNGQLGSEFRILASGYPHYHFIFTDVNELDICSEDQVNDFFNKHNVDVVVNCAAYTAVDSAEDEPEKAMALNRDAVANLAGACKAHNAYLIHISTDYVFDGTGSKPYTENDTARPATIYGQSKLEGEERISGCLEKGMIIRTSWLYSSFRQNFVKTIMNKCPESNELKVVNDQKGSPTYARDLARAILDIIPRALSMHRFEIFHYANEGECTWYEMACAIVGLAGLNCRVVPVNSLDYPQKAPRPAYSVLDKTKIKDLMGISIPHWKESLKEMITVLNVELN